MEQMLLLGNMDPRSLKENHENKNYFYTHECEHCGMLMKFQWEVRETYENKPEGGGGSYHAVCATRHLEIIATKQVFFQCNNA